MKWNVLLGVSIGFISAVFILLFAFAFMPSTEPALPPGMFLFLKDILGPVGAGFGGAIAGAYAAYSFQSEKESKKEKERKALDYSVALNILNSKRNDLASIKEKLIFPHRNKPFRFLSILTTNKGKAVDGDALILLAPLLISAGLYKLLLSLSQAEERYKVALWNLDGFIDLKHSLEMQRREHSLSKREKYNLAELKTIYGVSRIVALYNSTEEFIRGLDVAIQGLIDVIGSLQGDLASQLRKEQPGVELLVLEIDDSEVLKATPAPSESAMEVELALKCA